MRARLRALASRVIATLTRRRADQDFEIELRTHVDMLAEDYEARGMPAADARRAARLALGSPAALRESTHDARGLRWLSSAAQDLRFAVRTLWKSRSFAVVTVLSLGIGIGANTALFSLVDALLLRSLPVEAPDLLVNISRGSASAKKIGLDAGTIDALNSLNTIFSGVTASSGMPRPLVSIDGADEPDRAVQIVTTNFFQVLGISAQLGRLESREPAAIISDRFWSVRFSRDPDLLRRTVSVGGRMYAIAGVAPGGFHGLSLDASVDLWLTSRSLPPVAVALARLRPGVDPGEAAHAADALFQRLDATSPQPRAGPPPRTEVSPGGQGSSNLRQQYGGPLLALMALVVLVLLITCVNIGNLLVLRNGARVRELTLRAALGAGRSRLVALLTIESLVLAGAGGAVAWLAADWGVSAILSSLPVEEIPEPLRFRLDARMFLFLAALSVTSALLFSLLPAWRAARVDLTTALRTGLAHATLAGQRRRGSWLVVAQVALSVVLVAGAGLFVQTVRNAMRIETGFDPHNLIQVELAGRQMRFRPEEIRGVQERLLERVAAVPGVHAVTSYVSQLFPPWLAGLAHPDGTFGGSVGPDFFEIMRIPLRRGRLLTRDDVTRPQPVAVVSESYEREIFPGENVLGKRIQNGPFLVEVVGVVADAKLSNLRWKDAMIYRVGLREAYMPSSLQVRTSLDPASVMPAIALAVQSVHPRLLLSIRTVDDVIARSLARERLVAATSGFFAVIGLVLAGMGIFGVAAFAVAQRTNELGLRIALGASRSAVIREALRDTARVVSIGLGLGLSAAIALARLVESLVADLLLGLTATDAANLLTALAIMTGSAVTACLLPAFRATRIDPLQALRHE